jgi:hypothetical protein
VSVSACERRTAVKLRLEVAILISIRKRIDADISRITSGNRSTQVAYGTLLVMWMNVRGIAEAGILAATTTTQRSERSSVRGQTSVVDAICHVSLCESRGESGSCQPLELSRSPIDWVSLLKCYLVRDSVPNMRFP